MQKTAPTRNVFLLQPYFRDGNDGMTFGLLQHTSAQHCRWAAAGAGPRNKKQINVNGGVHCVFGFLSSFVTLHFLFREPHNCNNTFILFFLRSDVAPMLADHASSTRRAHPSGEDLQLPLRRQGSVVVAAPREPTARRESR